MKFDAGGGILGGFGGIFVWLFGIRLAMEELLFAVAVLLCLRGLRRRRRGGGVLKMHLFSFVPFFMSTPGFWRPPNSFFAALFSLPLFACPIPP